MELTQTQRDWLTLHLVPGVGTTLFIRLLARFETPGAVLAASEAALREVVGPKLAQRIRQYRDAVDIETQMRRMEAADARFITLDDPEYPPRLATIYDPPLVLFVRGALHEADENAVAIVGTRHASNYGLRMAEMLAGQLAARGITIVSGMALGIDKAAHEAALNAGGRSIAVLGCGVDIVYPPEHLALMQRLAQQGAVLSSFEMGLEASKGHFPQRNRIISGLSLGTIVVEAPAGSGALITARHAAEQGREVFAVPGRVGDHNSAGPHSLIREGAKLVETIEDILNELELPASAWQRPAAPLNSNPPKTAAVKTRTAATRRDAPANQQAEKPPGAPPAPASAAPSLSTVEKDILAALSPDGSFVDEIAMVCRIPISEALSSLTMLEIKGMVRQFSGKRFAPR